MDPWRNSIAAGDISWKITGWIFENVLIANIVRSPWEIDGTITKLIILGKLKKLKKKVMKLFFSGPLKTSGYIVQSILNIFFLKIS